MVDLAAIRVEGPKNDAIRTLRERAEEHRGIIKKLKDQADQYASRVAQMKAEIAQREADARQNDTAADILEGMSEADDVGNNPS